jgi:uncharacterized protein
MLWKAGWPDIPEDAPFDVLPASNGEYIPKDPSPNQLKIMALQDEKIEEVRRKFGMPRRDFVRTAAAMAVGVWAIDTVTGGRWGRYAFANTPSTSPQACDLENPGVQLKNLPGEFILDTQGHCLESNGKWRTEGTFGYPGDYEGTNTRPARAGGFGWFVLSWTSQAWGNYPGYSDGKPRGMGGGDLDPWENLGQYHFFKEMYLDSSITTCLLTALPNLPDETNITPMKFATETRDLINSWSKSERCFIHAFTEPNRGYQGKGKVPAQQAEDFEWMSNAQKPFDIRGWKLYCGWGEPMPTINGWWFDDENGMAVTEHIRKIHQKSTRPPVICTHKGLAFNGTFDADKFSPRDMGVIGRQFPDLTFMTYHCGYDGDYQMPYAGDSKVNSSNRGVDAFIKSLRENAWDATRFVPPGLEHGNTVNMWAEMGTVWWNVMADADQAAHLLGKLITYVGPRRIVLGTDCIWYGNPQAQFVLMRAFQFSDEAKAFYNLPYGLEGDRWDPRKNALDAASYMAPHPNVAGWPTDGKSHPERTIRNGIFGRNAAEIYGIDPDQHFGALKCDEVQKIRDAYYLNPGTPKERGEFKTNHILGPRNKREFWNMIKQDHPWSTIPGKYR